MSSKNKVNGVGDFYVYILACKDGSLYTGSTSDLDNRLHQHNNAKAGAHYTKIRRPVTLSYFERLKTYADARSREGEIKRLTRDDKMKLINKKH